MLLDMRVTGNRYDDRVFWGGFVSSHPGRQRALGTLFIYAVGTIVGAVYRALLPSLPRLPGPILGALFVEAENTLRWPGLATMNRLHPAVRDGQLPDLCTRSYFGYEAFRHTVFGLVLGAIVRRG